MWKNIMLHTFQTILLRITLMVKIMFRALYNTLYFDTDAKFAFFGGFFPVFPSCRSVIIFQHITFKNLNYIKFYIRVFQNCVLNARRGEIN